MKYLPEVTGEEIRYKLNHFSASQISMIMGCKFKWACRYIYGIRGYRKPGQNLQIGCFLHDTAKAAAIEGKKEFNKDIMLLRMKEKCQETKSLPADYYPKIIDTFLQAYGNLSLNNANTEVYIVGQPEKLGSKIRCEGYIDHIKTNDDGSRRIVDLKIKGTLEKDQDKNVIYSMSEVIQQGLYSYITGIRDTSLYIVHINKRTKNKDCTFIEVQKTFTDNDLNRVLNICNMYVYESLIIRTGTN